MNRQIFNTTKPNGRKQCLDLLNTLLDYNADADNDTFNDIHIKQEDYLIVLEWDRVAYDDESREGWHFIDYDEVVMKEVNFPDGSYNYVFPDDVETTLKDWHNNNPEWEKNEFGIWVNSEENRQTAIDWYLEDWCKREVEENDSTYSEDIIEISPEIAARDVEWILGSAPHHVLYRTDYIVVSPDFFKELNNKQRVIKLKDINFKFNYNMISNKDEKLERKFHIYTVPDWPGKQGEVYYLTNSNYLIYKQKFTKS